MSRERELNGPFREACAALADTLDNAREHAIGMDNARSVWFPEEVQSYFDDMVELVAKVQKQVDALKMMRKF